jgi:hypothetical protein
MLVHVFVYVRKCVRICVCVSQFKCMCENGYMCTCLFVKVFASMYVCICECVTCYVYMSE